MCIFTDPTPVSLCCRLSPQSRLVSALGHQTEAFRMGKSRAKAKELAFCSPCNLSPLRESH
jgi:hypothetical protein